MYKIYFLEILIMLRKAKEYNYFNQKLHFRT